MSKLSAFTEIVKKISRVAITDTLDERTEGMYAVEGNPVALMWWAVERDNKIHVCSEDVENSSIIKSVADFNAWCEATLTLITDAPVMELVKKSMKNVNLDLSEKPLPSVLSMESKNKLSMVVERLTKDRNAGLTWKFNNVNSESNTVYGTVEFRRTKPKSIVFDVWLHKTEKNSVEMRVGASTTVLNQQYTTVKNSVDATDVAYAAFDRVWPGQQDHLIVWDSGEGLGFYRAHSGTRLSNTAFVVNNAYVNEVDLTDRVNRALEEFSLMLETCQHETLPETGLKGQFNFVTCSGFLQ
jgi:hypothetical protein